MAQPIAGQNWTIVPVSDVAGNSPSTSVENQQWSVTLTGVAIVDLRGEIGRWRHRDLVIYPDIVAPLSYAGQRAGIDLPPPEGVDKSYAYALQLEQWAPFVTPASMLNEGHSIDSGFAVDTWRPAPFWTGKNDRLDEDYPQLFNGVVAEAAVSDNDAILYRIAYHFHLVGRIVVVTAGSGFPGPSS